VYYHGFKSDSKAFAWFHKAALQGHGSAQALVGWMYKSGTGVGKNYKLAMEWYLKGAAQDDFDAPSNIGYLYQYGLGVSIDYKEAMKWYMISANKDHPYALNNVGNLYHRGLGVHRNVETAIKWYTRAALLEEGGEGAQYNLASIYETDPKYKNLQKAVNWYQKAAECDFDQAADKVKCLNHRGYFPKPEQKGIVCIFT
jgi:TPR repeat protein